jgi:hypothetical protein
MRMAGLLARGSRRNPAFPALPASGAPDLAHRLQLRGQPRPRPFLRISPRSLFTPRLSARGPSAATLVFNGLLRNGFLGWHHRSSNRLHNPMRYVITLLINSHWYCQATLLVPAAVIAQQAQFRSN